ncbi:unnamed protein product, partial [Brenthis ino]
MDRVLDRASRRSAVNKLNESRTLTCCTPFMCAPLTHDNSISGNTEPCVERKLASRLEAPLKTCAARAHGSTSFAAISLSLLSPKRVT